MNNDNYYESIIYIAGPMTGLPNYNFEAFNTVAAILRFAYPKSLIINPAENFDAVQTHPREVYMRQDIKQLMRAATVVMLEGWQASEGATLEYDIAEALGLEIRLLEVDGTGIIWRDVNGYDLDLRDESDMEEECGGCDECATPFTPTKGDTYILELHQNGVQYEAKASGDKGSLYFTVDDEWAMQSSLDWGFASENEWCVDLYDDDSHGIVEYCIAWTSPFIAHTADRSKGFFHIRLSPIK
jgi:hypothetical protein